MIKNWIFLVSLALLAGCKPEHKPSELKETYFLKGVSLGKVDKKIEEASGLVESIAHPGMFWTHNDGENPAAVFLIDHHAEIRMTCTLKGIKNRDWEEITMGPGPEEGKNYIYVGDIGDNKAAFSTKLIYRFAEPAADNGEISITDFDTLEVKLPDGARDTEAMMIDPLSNDLILVSKREDSVRVYKIPYPFQEGVLTAERMATLALNKITAGALSTDGSEILLKDYDYIYYWKRATNQTVWEAMRQPPVKLAYAREEQGEAICFARDGSGFYTLGETVNRPAELMYYKRK